MAGRCRSGVSRPEICPGPRREKRGATFFFLEKISEISHPFFEAGKKNRSSIAKTLLGGEEGSQRAGQAGRAPGSGGGGGGQRERSNSCNCLWGRKISLWGALNYNRLGCVCAPAAALLRLELTFPNKLFLPSALRAALRYCSPAARIILASVLRCVLPIKKKQAKRSTFPFLDG